ncbi:nin one binding zn-ribbon family protein [Cystoisospora suis]|uniref:Nin one binding zn-ribbon family protein n=1 Tax=Cystoisospora suis TaxID=483139 RepID=A0A2C6L027_9APIC|nr:nin one binding zn-ribbon family protein [Cystoisospora suis]
MAATEQDKRWARKFASMTGDLGVLSGTDLDVIALTYMLQRRTGRVEKLRTKPLEPTVVRETSAPTETWDSGWWGCSKSSGSDRDTSEGKGETGDGTVSDSSAEDQDDSSFAGAAEDKASMLTEGEKEREEQDRRHEKRECTGVAERDGISAEETTEFPSGKDKAPPADEGSVAVPAGSIVDMGVAETREIVDVVGDDDDREGVWITSENLSRFKREVEGVSAGRKEEALVACMTTDYSVQNVLLQMGLDVVTIDGLAVRSVKSWALICRACHFVSREVTRLFCEKCGQHAVDRVPVTLTDDGLVVHDNRKKKSTRGNIHSLPKPRGGRHEKQLILAEDQLMLGGRDRMLRHQQRLWEKENSAHNPFSDDCVFDAASSWHVRARTRTGKLVAGTHAPRVVVGLGPGNPNSNRWVKSHARSKRK